MAQFFVIDRKRNVVRVEAKDKSSAYDEYNDSHTIKADLIIPTQLCAHNKYIFPPQPDWFLVHTTSDCKICAICSKAEEPKPTPPAKLAEPEISLFYNDTVKLAI